MPPMQRMQNTGGGYATAYLDTIVSVQDVIPMEITQPVFSECNLIPYCWYHNMEVAWNADPSNLNGVVVIVAWTGVKVQENTNPNFTPIYNVDLVEDNGYMTLNDNLFQGIPENAVVTLILLRANIVNVEINGESYHIDPDLYDSSADGVSEFIADFLFTRESILYNSYTIALGTEAHFSFVLIRESYHP